MTAGQSVNDRAGWTYNQVPPQSSPSMSWATCTYLAPSVTARGGREGRTFAPLHGVSERCTHPGCTHPAGDWCESIPSVCGPRVCSDVIDHQARVRSAGHRRNVFVVVVFHPLLFLGD